MNRTVWHRSTPVGFCREEGGEVEGKFDRGGWRWRVGRAYPNLFSKRPPRIVSTTSTTTTRPRTPMLPYVIPFLFCFPAVPFARHHLSLPPPTTLSISHPISLFLFTSPIPFSNSHRVCGIFLRKIDRPSDCLSCTRFSSLSLSRPPFLPFFPLFFSSASRFQPSFFRPFFLSFISLFSLFFRFFHLLFPFLPSHASPPSPIS